MDSWLGRFNEGDDAVLSDKDSFLLSLLTREQRDIDGGMILDKSLNGVNQFSCSGLQELLQVSIQY